MMTTTSDEPEDSRTLTGLTALYRDTLGPPTPSELDRGYDAFVARVAAGKTYRRGVVRWSLVGATAALGILVALHLAQVSPKPARPAPPLAYQIDGGSVIEGGYLREAGHTGMTVRFNEGSSFALTPGTRGRIQAVDQEGARVAIEHGTADFQVTPSSSRRWLVDVGPFLVTVKGTVFTVSWHPLHEQFELRLRQGSVVVNGPVSAGEIALRAGQRLVVNLAKVETVITEDTPEPASTGPTDTPDPPLAPAARAPDLPAANKPGPAPAPRSGGEHRWGEALARGHWDRILADAQRMGVQTTLDRASSEDLFALADAARYRRRPELARAALLAERRRFPDSPRTLDATYLLGRVEESRENGTARAIAWYDEYLARAPSGPFVGEALGRKMTLTDKLAGPARARPVAEDYLRRFPKGNYAGSARELIRAP
jgi:hypothetical protein